MVTQVVQITSGAPTVEYKVTQTSTPQYFDIESFYFDLWNRTCTVKIIYGNEVMQKQITKYERDVDGNIVYSDQTITNPDGTTETVSVPTEISESIELLKPIKEKIIKISGPDFEYFFESNQGDILSMRDIVISEIKSKESMEGSYTYIGGGV